jgi:CBS domain-containing protein
MVASVALLEHEPFQRVSRGDCVGHAQALRGVYGAAQTVRDLAVRGRIPPGGMLGARLAHRSVTMLADSAQRLKTSVADLMTRRPITIGPDEVVGVAATLLRTCRVRHLPVVAHGALVGVVSLRDILAAEDEQRLETIMSAPVQATGPDAPVEGAAERLLGKRISCLPVVEGERLVGIFTATDALRFAAAALDEGDRLSGRKSLISGMMTPRPVVTVTATVTLGSAWRTMQAARIRHLPVIAGEGVIGILSDRDILAAGRAWLKAATSGDDGGILVADAMSPRVTTLAAERPAVEAARVLLRRRVGAVPVTRAGALVGILTVSDFLYWVVNRE